MKEKYQNMVNNLWNEIQAALDALYNEKARPATPHYKDSKGYPIRDICCRFSWIAKIDDMWCVVDKWDGTQYNLNVLDLDWLCRYVDELRSASTEGAAQLWNAFASEHKSSPKFCDCEIVQKDDPTETMYVTIALCEYDECEVEDDKIYFYAGNGFESLQRLFGPSEDFEIVRIDELYV
ncbi:MAG: hypothetical protein II825_03450 [Paludibacteraceae bacterium]|nr:hypothetical protein [Paludibacteraceae bacterium]